MTDGVELWRGEFGDAYTERNQVDWRLRVALWDRVIEMTGARSVFEVGCNAGWNLSAIRLNNPQVRVAGSDINPRALEQANAAGLEVYECLDFRAVPGKFDLVFTAGVLIHIEPQHLREVMRALIDKSFRWVAAVEYEAPYETAIEYRGHSDKCWKRPYDVLYKDLGLQMLTSWWKPVGFDDCTAWLMQR
ncbi:MAG: pseudaminic acid biosynthesis-associated methylase [Candidatus Nanopelagicales bacterium]